MPEYMTEAELRQHRGEEFFLSADRFDRIVELHQRGPSAMFDELWVSAHDEGVQRVEGGRVLGMRVVVTVTVPQGEMWMWSDFEGGFRK